MLLQDFRYPPGSSGSLPTAIRSLLSSRPPSHDYLDLTVSRYTISISFLCFIGSCPHNLTTRWAFRHTESNINREVLKEILQSAVQSLAEWALHHQELLMQGLFKI